MTDMTTPMFDDRQTRKDWRKRTWPSGMNSQFAKREASKTVRRTAKKDPEAAPKNNLYKKQYDHYDICDFK